MIEAPNLWALIEARAAETPDALLARDDQGRDLTFAAYKAEAERVAAGLAERYDVGDGTNVSWQLPTWNESLVLVAALSRLGAVQNPILPIYREREVGFAVRQTGAHVLVVPSTFRGFDFEPMAREIATSAGAATEVLVVDRGDALPAGDASSLPPPPSAGDEAQPGPVRWVFYTSGTTADPKGARHTDASVAAASRAMADALRLGPDDVHGLIFPFTHIGGICWLFAALMTGCRQIVVEAWDPSTTIDLLDREGVTLAGSGTVFHQAYLTAARERPDAKLLSNVRAFPGGAAPKPPQLHYDLKDAIGGAGIVSGYGLTECPILAMNRVDDPDDELANTEGRPTAGVELRIVDGEIRVKAPQLFAGYVDVALDAAAFDEDGFFRTGDLGHLDGAGFVVITGRLKDVIIRKGENISAKEVEDLLYRHPKVADVAVIGLPDPSLGERCCAVVQPADAADPPTLDDIGAFLRGEGLMVQKVPEQLEVVDQIPRNPAGKILKHDLRERFGAESSPVVSSS